jgi:hypothetical protein
VGVVCRERWLGWSSAMRAARPRDSSQTVNALTGNASNAKYRAGKLSNEVSGFFGKINFA